MISFIVTLFLVTFFFVGFYLYKRWFNPIFLYVGSWAFTLYLFDWHLLGFIEVSDFAWLTILFAFFAFLAGCIIVYLAYSIYYDNHHIVNEKVYPGELWSDKKILTLRRMIIFTAILGVLVSLQHWYVLIQEFGSIPMVLLKGGEIYSMRVGGEHFGKIPYIILLSYVSVFLSAIYSAYRNRFTYLVIFPMIAVILTDAASLARAGVFFAFILFGITFMTARYYFKTKTTTTRYLNNKNIIVTVVIIVMLALASVSLIKFIRNPLGDYEYQATSIELKKLSEDGLISPSLYLYFSSPAAVLTRYLENRNEVAIWGENTFQPVFRNLNKFGADVNIKPYPKGYFVPMWVNSATYIRELDVDFGPMGILVVPFLIGFLSTFFWFRFFQRGNFIYLTLYAFTSVIIVFSVFYIGTRLSFWMFSFIFSIIAIWFFNRKQTNISQLKA